MEGVDNSKDFDRWNEIKKKLDSTEKLTDFREREIWWCSVGINVGHEQHSDSTDFSRPVLIIRKFSKDMFWGIPFTTRLQNVGPRFRFDFEGVKNEALLLHMRSYDHKRLIYKLGIIPKETYAKILREIKSLL